MKTSMKIIVTGSLLALSSGLAMSALAAPKPPAAAAATVKHDEATTGAISVISASEVKLANGDTFKVSPGVSTAAFKAGEKVKVQWSMKDGAKIADHISATKK
jgi:hypothetical protein